MSQKISIPAEMVYELTELRNELITIVMRMEKVLRTTGCPSMRDDIKKLKELLK